MAVGPAGGYRETHAIARGRHDIMRQPVAARESCEGIPWGRSCGGGAGEVEAFLNGRFIICSVTFSLRGFLGTYALLAS